MDHLAAGPAVIVGHSGGGGTALGLALSDPERVQALVLISPGVPDYPWPQDDPYVSEFVQLLMAGDREGVVRLGLATWAPAGADATVTAEISAAVAAFLTVGELEQPDPPAYDRLSEIRAPAVMVRGDREYPMVADCADAIASRIPGCRRIVIPGADHMLPLPGRPPNSSRSVPTCSSVKATQSTTAYCGPGSARTDRYRTPPPPASMPS